MVYNPNSDFLLFLDESGDVAMPGSNYFIYSGVYFDNKYYIHNRVKHDALRLKFQRHFNLPSHIEFHTNNFIRNKRPYSNYNLSDQKRRDIAFKYANMICHLDCHILNVAINKNKIVNQFNILQKCFTYIIQRCENALKYDHNSSCCDVVVDQGHMPIVRRAYNQMITNNTISSICVPGARYQRNITLISTPAGVNSQHEIFIQIADFITYIVKLYLERNISSPAILGSPRITSVLKPGDEIDLLNIILPKINLKATKYKKTNPYGIVIYPT